jgi:hypothetical protein
MDSSFFGCRAVTRACKLVRIIQSPDYKQRQLEVAADVVGSSPRALGDFQKTEIEKYRMIAASAGITPE